MKSSILFALAGILLMLSSCAPSLSPFTQKLQDENKWNTEDLKKIQFYLSDNIVLRRKVNEGETRILNGKIRTINGEKVEEIVFRSGTPCVFIFSPKEERFAISFEQSDPPKFLMFGPNPNYSNRYTLLGKEWDRQCGTVTYQDESWYTSSTSAYAGLLVDLKRARNIERKSQIVKGQRVGE